MNANSPTPGASYTGTMTPFWWPIRCGTRVRYFLSESDAMAYEQGYSKPHDCTAPPGTPEFHGWADREADDDVLDDRRMERALARREL